MTKAETLNDKHFRDEETNVELEIIEREELCDWLCDNYKNFGTTLEFITDTSQEGNQFVKGFGGIGGLLRYRLDFEMHEEMVFSDDLDFI